MKTSKRTPSVSAVRQLQPMPSRIEPMLAVAGPMPANEHDYAFEFKWDGVRVIAFCDHGRLKLRSRNCLDITIRYPELQALAKSMARRAVILDGEVIAMGPDNQ